MDSTRRNLLKAGTSAAVGFARKPPEFLKDGDVIETEITGAGIIRNTIRAEA
jgi:2-keto-4-pentenoate hydratase/2-oxohepta-3-ene-1,7-dioic acid hydratase in catechol pathway